MKKCFGKFIFLIIFYSVPIYGVAQDYPYAIPRYNFVRYSQNVIQNVPSSTYFENLFEKMNELNSKGQGILNIVHIGDSHIQADVLTHRIRTRLQNFIPGGYGGLGYVFPYRLAHSNNPINYYAKVRGSWISKTNIKYHPSLQMGVGGVAAKTIDPNATIEIVVRSENGKKREFDKVIVFYVAEETSFDIHLNKEILSVENYPKLGYSVFYLKDLSDRFTLSFKKSNANQNKFILNGFSLETSYQGIRYHEMGINGADVPAWLSCNLLEKQLKALHPDMFVISLGTNDLYTKNFDSTQFAINYKELIGRIKSAFPGVPIIATTPGDHYLYKRYLNQKTPQAVGAISRLSEEMGFAVWDFFHIMGGLNSIVLWTKYGLGRSDRVHYTGQGYAFQGDLFFNAFLHQWDTYLDEKQAYKAEVTERIELKNATGL